MRTIVGSIFVTFAVYLLFAGTLSVSEAVTGAVLSVMAGCAALLLGRISEAHFTVSVSHLPVWGRAVAGVPAATLRTGAALVGTLLSRDAPGQVDVEPFRSGKAAAPDERARRATAVLAASLAPNSFVVRIDAAHATALLHGIDATPPTQNAEWLA